MRQVGHLPQESNMLLGILGYGTRSVAVQPAEMSIILLEQPRLKKLLFAEYT